MIKTIRTSKEIEVQKALNGTNYIVKIVIKNDIPLFSISREDDPDLGYGRSSSTITTRTPEGISILIELLMQAKILWEIENEKHFQSKKDSKKDS